MINTFRSAVSCFVLTHGLLLFAPGSLVSISLSAAPATQSTRGELWTGAPGIRETTASLMARDAEAAVQGRAKSKVRLKFEFDLPEEANPDSPDAPPSTDQQLDFIPQASDPAQTPGTSFTGATLADTSAYPPDSMGAVGPAQFIVAVNGRIRSFNKNTGAADGLLNVDTDVFFNSVMTPPVTNNFTSDPRIRYDRLSGRWFIIMIDVPGKTGNLPDRVMIVVSDSAVITASTAWTFFYFQHDTVGPAGDTGLFADYPTLGIDAKALYIGVNLFGTRGVKTSFSNTSVFVVRKSSILGNGPIVVTAFRDLIPHGNAGGPFTPHGVDNYDPAATEGYIIGVNSRFYGLLELRRISDPGGASISISDNISISIALNGPTINVPHLGNTGGTAGYLDGLDYRLLSAHVRNGRLWTSANMGVDNNGTRTLTATRNGVRWYELAGIGTGQTPGVRQFGTLFQPSPSNTSDQRSYWMGTVMVSGQGHVAGGCSAAGASEYVNAATFGRLVNDPTNIMRMPLLYTSSSTAYNPRDRDGNPINRWGDYSYTCLDPDDDMTMWTIQEFCDAANSYGVRVVKLIAPAPATPINCNPAIVSSDTTLNVLLTGASDGKTGFFDPGAGFSNRISAAVSGSGVSVNTVSYTDPTHLTLNLTIAPGAATGTRTITVTNPDGQSASSVSGILTIGGGNSPPTISAIADGTTSEDANTAAIPFTVGDLETIAAVLTLSFTSSNTNLVPNANFLFGGSGSNRTVMLFPATNEFGQTTITVTVTDGGGASAAATFLLTVTPVNDAPGFLGGANQTVSEDSGTQNIPGWASLISPGPANEVSQMVNFITTNSNPGLFAAQPTISSAGTLTFTPASNANGAANVTVQLHDDGGTANGGSDTSLPFFFTINVMPVNDLPIADSQSVGTTEDTPISITLSGSDVEGSPLTYAIVAAPAHGVLTGTGSTQTYSPATNFFGMDSFTFKVNDGMSDSQVAMVSVTVSPVNDAPVLAPIADQTIAEGNLLSITNSAANVDSATLVFSLEPGFPPGASIDPTSGVFTWTPAEDQGPGTNVIGVRVTDDGLPVLSDMKSFTVVVTEVNQPPAFLPAPRKSVHATSPVSLSLTATDPDFPTNQLIFSLEPGAPDGAALDAATGVFTWAPTESQIGTNGIIARVSDDGMPSLSDLTTITVVVAPRPALEIASNSNGSVNLSWSALPGHTYRVQWKILLVDANWNDLAGDITAADATATKADNPGPDAQRFYRVMEVNAN
jgi:hypothetical protein